MERYREEINEELQHQEHRPQITILKKLPNRRDEILDENLDIENDAVRAEEVKIIIVNLGNKRVCENYRGIVSDTKSKTLQLRRREIRKIPCRS